VHVLGIETATSIASVGIVNADRVLTELEQPMRGSHARTLLPLIDAALAAAHCELGGLDLIAVSIGPGSFTGLRIGLSVAKGLALATGLRVVGVPTLEAYAHRAGPRPGLLCPVLDARKGEVYGAAFQFDQHGGAGSAVAAAAALQCLIPPAAIAPKRFAASLPKPCTLFGDGVDAYAELWQRELGDDAELIPFADLTPSGAVVARLAIARAATADAADLTDLEPSYCRQSEAELTHARLQIPAGVEKLTAGRW
jgi:tRNA threonylcarbamoyladenosine biosynthesis protein TsaB